MSFFDLLHLILDNLSRRKARVAMTAIGVVIGSAAVVILVSLGIGLQRNATSQLYGISDLARIDVYPKYGDYGPVMIEASGMPIGPPPNQKLLTEDSIAEILTIPGVKQVIPRDYSWGETILIAGRMEAYVGISGVGGVSDLSEMGIKTEAGSLALDGNSIIIGRQVPTFFYDPKWRPGQDPPVPPDLLGQTIKLTIRKYDDQGQAITRSYRVTVSGIMGNPEEDYSIYMPISTVTKFSEWAMGRRINRNKEGYQNFIVRVEDPQNAVDVTEVIKELGYEAYTGQSYLEGINSFFLIMQIIFGGVGATALLVAAIGIANTMAMAILERTREIGLMKALGATNRDVLSVFLGEAAGIGMIGGIGGVLIGWSGSQILNVLAVAYMAGQSAQQGGLPPTLAVYTPAWLPIFALVFSTLIGMLSGLYPALRAANLIPINALKYE
jgi:putative ABC transport system permease protein